MSQTRRLASYLGALAPAGYGLAAQASSVVNYLLDSYFWKIDERDAAARARRKPVPGDIESHIRELWLGCEIHLCLSLSQAFPAYAKSLNCYAFSRLFTLFNPAGAYDVVPFLDQYEYKDILKGSREYRIQSEQLNISLTDSVTLPVYGTFFVVNKVSGAKLIVSFDFCYYGPACSVSVLASPQDQPAAEQFFADLRASMRANDIYLNKCLAFDKGHLDFFGIIGTKWDEVVLKDDVKSQIRENSVGILANMSTLASVGMVPNRNVILISPPGMAKTTMFRATSNEVDGAATRIWCTGKSIMYPDHVTALFEAARSLAPAIVFIEDMDLFGGERTMAGRDSSVLNEFLAQLDGAQANAGIVVMASTNDIASMDEALVNRPGRFSVKVDIPYPDEEDRRKMLRNFLASFNVKPDPSVTPDTIKTVVDLCDGFTGDYIKELAKAAVIRAAANGRAESGLVSVCADDLTVAAEQVLRNFKIGKRSKKHHFVEVEADLATKAG